jgi:hypothetical protein
MTMQGGNRLVTTPYNNRQASLSDHKLRDDHELRDGSSRSAMIEAAFVSYLITSQRRYRDDIDFARHLVDNAIDV